MPYCRTTLSVGPRDLESAEVRVQEYNGAPLTSVRVGDVTIQSAEISAHGFASALAALAIKVRNAAYVFDLEQAIAASRTEVSA